MSNGIQLLATLSSSTPCDASKSNLTPAHSAILFSWLVSKFRLSFYRTTSSAYKAVLLFKTDLKEQSGSLWTSSKWNHRRKRLFSALTSCPITSTGRWNKLDSSIDAECRSLPEVSSRDQSSGALRWTGVLASMVAECWPRYRELRKIQGDKTSAVCRFGTSYHHGHTPPHRGPGTTQDTTWKGQFDQN